FQENDQGDVPAYWKPDELDQEEDDDEDTAETCNLSTGRQSKMSENDPVHKVRVLNVVQSVLGQLEQSFNGGPDGFRQWLQTTIDPIIMEEIRALLSPS
ncbi:hypothetical protein H4R35_007579, partial [Dimargaris xerosporica]